MTTPSDGYTVTPAGLRERVENASRLPARHAALALTVGCIIALAVLKAAGADSSLVSDVLGGVLVVAFIALAFLDFRLSVAVAIFELVLGGAGGHWIDYGGGLSGRIFLDSVVTLRAAGMTVADWRRGRHPLLGRYVGHALAIAFLMPAIWIPVGLANGNSRGDAVSDGNGFLFFAFVLVVSTLVRRGYGAWFRRVFFAACAANGAAYFLLIVVTTTRVVSLHTVQQWLGGRLGMGGVIGYMPNGDYRLFTAGSLFLQVGLALTTQRLLAKPRDLRLWLLGGILSADLVATYTRGLWGAALITVGLVIVLGVRNVREAGIAVGVPAAIAGLALVVAPLGGFSLYSYVAGRAATVTEASHTKYPVHVRNPSFEASSSAWGVNDAGAHSLRVVRTAVAARAGTHSLELSNSAGGEDAYAFQNIAVKPDRKYSVSAWVDVREFRGPAAAERGLMVWDAQDGLVYTVPLTSGMNGWRRMWMTFATRGQAKALQIRLYAPEGRVLWDAVRLDAGGRVHANFAATGQHLEVTSVPVTTQAAQAMALAATGGGGGTDAAGAASNEYRIAEAKSLLRHIRKSPIYGSGFGSVARDFSTGYSYELSYLDLLFKTGVLGLLLYLSFPLRLVIDALRLRRRPADAMVGGTRGGAPGVVVGVILGILIAGATNPYLFAAFGLVSMLAMVAWLEEARAVGGEPAQRR